MKNTFLVASALIFISLGVNAQQIGLTNQYLINPYVQNPAYAGGERAYIVNLGVRNQLIGLKDAPEYKFININGPIDEKMGMGARVVTENAGILSRLTANLSWSYGITLAEEHYLTFGIEAQAEDLNFSLSNADVNDASDQVLQSGSRLMGTTFDANAGLRYEFKGLDLGIAGLQLIENRLQLNNGGENANYTLRRHLVANVGYSFSFKEDLFQVKPLAFIRWANGAALSYDAGLMAGWNDMVWLAFTYRANGALIPSLVLDLRNKFRIGYSYEIATGTVANYTNGSHELFAGIRFGKASDQKTKKKNKLKEQLDSLDNNLQEVKTQLDQLKIDQDSLKREAESKDVEIENLKEQIKKLQEAPLSSNEKAALEKAIEEDPSSVRVGDAAVGKDKTTGTSGSDSKAKTGKLKEIEVKEDGTETSRALEKGYYVVVAAYKVARNAEKGLEQIRAKSVEAMMVFNEEREWYYVYLKKSKNLNEALSQMKKVREDGNPKAWVHVYIPE